MSRFDFIDKPLLRGNIESVHSDVLRLGTLLDSLQENAIENCVRKTIVIYTASIIEAISQRNIRFALLLWKLNKEIAAGNLEIWDEWQLKDIGCTVPLKSDPGNDIVIAEKIREERMIEGVDFKRRIDLSDRHGVIAGELVEKLHEVRSARNKLHIDGLEEVRKNYDQGDVDFVFAVLREVAEAVV